MYKVFSILFCSLSTTTMSVLVSHHQFILLDLKVPQDLSSVILHHFWSLPMSHSDFGTSNLYSGQMFLFHVCMSVYVEN